MNHIYKVIWNTITQTWVAVSELSRAKGKTKSSKTLSAVVLAAVSAGAIIGDAEAATNFVQNQTGIAITRSGGNAPATASDRWAIAVGDSAKANSEYSIAVGGHTNATGESAIAIGKQTKAEGQGATAVGRVTLASAQYSSAYGAQAKATGDQSTALGYVANAGASNSLAAGALAQAQGESSVALGRDAQAWGSGASAVGEGSRANNSNAFAGGNGAQATGSWATAVGPSTLASGEASAAYGDSSEATGKKSIATGSHASASAENAIAIGNSTKAQANNTIAIGNGTKATDKSENSLVIGQGAVVTAKDATVVGPVAQANGENATAVGRGAAANGTESTALGRGSVATGNQSIALGKGANAKVDSGVALGDDSVADRTARSQNGIVINTSNPSKSTGFNTENSVYAPVRLVDDPEALNLIKNTIKGNKGAVSVGDSGNTRQIINVAAGSADSDAVNVAQLKAVAGSIKKYTVTSPDGSITVTSPTSGQDPQNFQISMNTTAVQNAAAWNLKEGSETGNGEQVRGGDTVSFTDTETINVARNRKTLTFNANTASMSADGNNEGKIWTSDSSNRYLAKTKNVVDAINTSGWILQANGNKVGLVNPGDKVNIASGNGITVTPTTEANGVSKITINATVAGIKAGNNVTVSETGGVYTINATDTNTQASVSKLSNDSPITIDSDGTNSAGAKDYKLDVNVDKTTITKTGGVLKAVTGNLNVNGNGNLDTPQTGSALVNATTLANVVNDTYWKAAAGGNHANGKTNLPADKVKSSSTVTFNAGKNLTVDHSVANNFTFALNNVVDLTNAGSLTIGGTTVTDGGVTIKAKEAGKTDVTLTANGLDNGKNKIVNVATGEGDNDAVNVKQLKSTERHITPTTYTYNETDKSVTLTYTDGNGEIVANTKAKIDLSGLANKIKDYSFKTNATGSNLVGTVIDTTVASGKSVNFAASDNLTLKQDVKDGNVTYTYGLKNQVVVGEKGTPGADGKSGKDGVDGSIGVNGKDGSAVAINGKDGSIGLNGKDGKNGLTIKGQDGKVGVDGKDGETRLVYVEKADPTKPGSSDKTHELATLDDGQKYAGDNYVAAKDNQAESNVIAKKANERLDIVGGAKGNLTEGNIGVNAKDGKLHVQLAKELKDLTSAEFKGGDDSTVTNITNSGITIKPANSNDDSKTVSLTNTGLNNGGNKITNVAEGENDTDAVNVKQLKDFKSEVAEGGLTFAGNSGTAHKAKLNTTVNIKGGKDNTDATKFDNGKNVMTTVNGNTVTVSIKKTPEVEGINIIDTTGKVKVKLTQTSEGLKVSDGNNNATRITNVKAGEKDTDAVNVKQLNAAKTEVTAGDNIDVRSSTGANGQTIYKVSANDTSAAVKGGSDHVKVTKAANTHKDGSTTVTDYTVDLSDKTKGDIGKGVKAYDKVTNEGLTFNADKGSTGVKKLGSKVAVNGDGKNITTTADENGVKVSMKDDINVSSVTANKVKVGDVNINENGINAGSKRITNVAPGKDGTDAVNVNQLKYVAGNISNQINNVDKGLRAGIAGALASGGLYHVTTAGKSMVSVGAGTYRGQNALAVGYSRLSDNGKVGVKFTVNSNSQGHAGASASVGYQW